MDYSVSELLWLFFIYAFLGWCLEVCFVTVNRGQVVNRGFLGGPVCPIYGVGMLGVLLVVEPVKDNLFLLFLLGGLLCSAVELFTGWILEKIFHTRWWDYTDRPFQLGGYICLEFSLMWGLAVTFAVRLIHPMIMGLVERIPTVLGWILLGVLLGLFVADMIVTLVTILGIRKQLTELQQVADSLHEISDAMSRNLGTRALNVDAKLEEAKENLEQRSAESREKREQFATQSRQKLDEAKEALEQRSSESREKREQFAAQSRQKLEEAKETLEQRVSETRSELHLRQQRLELRQQELRSNLFTAPKFFTRRLGAAFPALKEALSRRHGDK